MLSTHETVGYTLAGIADDTCAPFVGLNWLHGFDVAAKTDVEDVRSKQCYVCTWGGNCGFIPR